MKLLNIILLVATAVLAGCNPSVNGPELAEQGEVYETCFIPKGHGSGSSVGISTDGALTTSSTSLEIPARYAVVFKCSHGKFVIDGERGQYLYKKLSKGDRVNIRYCEVLKNIKGQFTPVDLHFIDANVIGNLEAK